MIRNGDETPETVILEPWTTQHHLKPGGAVTVLAEGDARFPLEIEVRGNEITVYCFDSKGALLEFSS